MRVKGVGNEVEQQRNLQISEVGSKGVKLGRVGRRREGELGRKASQGQSELKILPAVH